jgi:hypothetical protein
MKLPEELNGKITGSIHHESVSRHRGIGYLISIFSLYDDFTERVSVILLGRFWALDQLTDLDEIWTWASKYHQSASHRAPLTGRQHNLKSAVLNKLLRWSTYFIRMAPGKPRDCQWHASIHFPQSNGVMSCQDDILGTDDNDSLWVDYANP